MNLPRLLSTLEQWLEQWKESSRLPNSACKFTLKRLLGDGSTRTFFRVEQVLSGKVETSYILLSDPEWNLSKDYAAHQEFLSQASIPVPRFYRVDPKAGVLLMEDLGDELLQLRMQAEPSERMAWLDKATRLLAQLHGRTYPVPATLPVATRSFDRQKYADELAFTFEHLHHHFLGLPKPTESQALLQFCEKIAAITPVVFAHRDYHCRNILLNRGKLTLIDFQDARMGSPHYDLASLIYDAYVPINAAERAQLTASYRAELSAFPLHAQIRWPAFEGELKQVALQRVLKAAGSFASFYTRYGKPTHLMYLEPALKSASLLLDEVASPELKALFPVADWQKRCPQKIAEAK